MKSSMKKTAAAAATLTVVAITVGTEHFDDAQSGNSSFRQQSVPLTQYTSAQSFPAQHMLASSGSSSMAESGQATSDTQTHWLTFKDPKTGMWSEKLPYPVDWRMNDEGVIGPEGTRIKEVMGDVSRQNRTIDQIINGKLIPMLKQENNRILNVETYTVLAQKLKEHYSQYWSVAPTKNNYSVKAIEYEDDNGMKGMLIVYFVDSRSQFANINFYYMGLMEAPANRYDTSKSAFLYAQANKRVNPKNIAVHNRKEQQKAANSNRRFQARQAQKQRQFDSWMNTQRQISNSTMDSSMDSWRSRNDMIDNGQDMQVNSIHEQTEVTHPTSGESWTVDDGYNRYFLNDDQQYISTDDYFYNPNMDPNVDNQQWHEVNSYD